MLSSALVAMPFGSFLLSIDLWLPYKLNTIILLLSFLIIFAMRETLRKSSTKDRASEERTDVQDGGSSAVILTQAQDYLGTLISEHQANSLLGQIRRLRSTIVSLIQKMKQSLVALSPSTVRKEITLVLLLLFLTMFCSMTGRIFIQYASKLLGWSISTAGYILGIRAFVALLVLFCLAAITRILEKKGTFRPLLLDVWIVRFSFVALTVGTAFIGMSRDSGLFITGTRHTITRIFQ
jgi:hypothetical protein